MEKKVLIVTALAGFIRSFLINDIKILQEMGYEVHCAANKNHFGSGEVENQLKNIGVKFHQIDFSSDKPLSKKTYVSLKQMKKLCNENHFSMIHCHTPIAGAICRCATRKLRRNGVKVLYTTHGFYFHENSSKSTRFIFKNIEDFMSRFTDVMITINKEDFVNAKKMHCSDVRYINGVGVDTKKFNNFEVDNISYRSELGIKENDLMILAIGELSKRKNHQIIIRALEGLKDYNPVFAICGSAINQESISEELKELANTLGVKIKLLGLRSDIPEICKCANIGVLPSKREGLGLAGIEMLASGIPIVASNVQGIKDYVKNGVNGYLCNPDEEQEFAMAIRNIVNGELGSNIKNTCMKSAENFDLKISVNQMKKIYSFVLNNDRG